MKSRKHITARRFYSNTYEAVLDNNDYMDMSWSTKS